jgi:hypothetical protein
MTVGSLETVKLVSDIASNVVTIVVAVLGVVTAYLAFFSERKRWPKADLKLVMSHRQLTDDKVLLHVKVKISNAGRSLMKLSALRVDVRQVLPLLDETAGLLDGDGLVSRTEGGAKARWETIDTAHPEWDPDEGRAPEIEPGENDELRFDFVLPTLLETAFIYVYVQNVKKRKRKVGWTVTSLYDLRGSSGGESANNLVSEEA